MGVPMQMSVCGRGLGLLGFHRQFRKLLPPSSHWSIKLDLSAEARGQLDCLGLCSAALGTLACAELAPLFN